MSEIEKLIASWKSSVMDDCPGGRLELEELDEFVGASAGVACSNCDCSKCPSCQSGCGC